VLQLDDFETVCWDAFAPEVAVAFEGIPQSMALNYIRQAAIDLAEKSQVLVRELDVPLQPCVTEYLLEVPTCERIVSVQSVGIRGDAQGCPCARGSRTGRWSAWRCHRESFRFEYPNRMTVNVGPHPPHDPHRPEELRPAWVRVAVAPTRDSCDVNRRFYEVYHEAVVNGAIARLLLIPKTGWTNVSLAAVYEDKAKAAITAAGIDRMIGGMRGPFRMKSRRVI
jgi:hypothetical protein